MDKLEYIRKSMGLNESFNADKVQEDITNTLVKAIVTVSDSHIRTNSRYVSSSDEEAVKRFAEVMLQTLSEIYKKLSELEEKIDEAR